MDTNLAMGFGLGCQLKVGVIVIDITIEDSGDDFVLLVFLGFPGATEAVRNAWFWS